LYILKRVAMLGLMSEVGDRGGGSISDDECESTDEGPQLESLSARRKSRFDRELWGTGGIAGE
jgi:hypothetical protein